MDKKKLLAIILAIALVVTCVTTIVFKNKYDAAISDSQQAETAADEKIAGLEGDIKTLTEELEAAKQELAAATLEIAGALGLEADEDIPISDAIAGIGAALDSKQAELEEAKKRGDDLEAELEAVTAEKQAALDDLAAAQGELESAQALIDETEIKLASAQNLLAQSEEEAEGLKARADSAEAELEDARALIVKAEGELESMRAQAADADADIEAKAAQITALQADLDEANDSLTAFSTAESDLSKELSEVKSDLSEAKKTITQKNSEINSLKSEIVPYENEIARLEKQLAEAGDTTGAPSGTVIDSAGFRFEKGEDVMCIYFEESGVYVYYSDDDFVGLESYIGTDLPDFYPATYQEMMNYVPDDSMPDYQLSTLVYTTIDGSPGYEATFSCLDTDTGKVLYFGLCVISRDTGYMVMSSYSYGEDFYEIYDVLLDNLQFS